MDNASNSSPIFPDDDLPIAPPAITLWDEVGFDHVLYPGSSKLLQGLDDGNDCRSKKMGKGLEGSGNQDVQKKLMHKEIERQRRQEMSGLYSSLRAVLPAEVIKGKRSISDQIHEASKYISRLKNNIRDLESKRDMCKLKKSVEDDDLLEQPPMDSPEMDRKAPVVAVTVQACSLGIEVLISAELSDQGMRVLPLSRVLQMLHQEGLEVITYNCSKYDGRWHCIIQSEVRGGYHGVNLPMLQKKLMAMINLMTNMNQGSAQLVD